jgi:hypothetical protein
VLLVDQQNDRAKHRHSQAMKHDLPNSRAKWSPWGKGGGIAHGNLSICVAWKAGRNYVFREN